MTNRSATNANVVVNDARLQGRVAVITGAGRGLGRAVAEGFARAGASTIAVARTTVELDDLAAHLGPITGSLAIESVDIADDSAVRTLAERVLGRHGRVDVLVNNAAILEIQPFHEMTIADFDRTMNVNLRGAVLCTHAFIGAMRARQQGSIINVGSGASTKGFTGETHYCAAKFGLEGFSEALALEARDYNVAVNRLSPGFRIKPTSITLADAATVDPETSAQWRDPAPMVDAFIFLALQDATGITGKLFNAFELAERVRAEGWTLTHGTAD